ncbi:Cupin domain-containing protein [Paraburkholderia unamae]|uniref:cupin domain-containing protein n=1 Tax=Paraburkholderia unamae TaxID=219649 RepID=UPI001CB2B02C|nr:cupin domain-containing protein [Paraburkholderia unamae]CAG9251916.1 Cupin domain-containing protein [Paraburkholderia unamae]
MSTLNPGEAATFVRERVAASGPARHDGRLVPFGAYLDAAARTRPRAAHWSAAAIDEARRRFPHGERGTVALVADDAADEGDRDGRTVRDPVFVDRAVATSAHYDASEAAPGVSLTVQIVEPARDTQAHRHAFWHLYVVVTGCGIAHVDEAGTPIDALSSDESAYPLAAGDALYVPPWAAHRFENPHRSAPLVLYALQNLPQLAALGTLVREASHGGIAHVYRAPSGAPRST